MNKKAVTNLKIGQGATPTGAVRGAELLCPRHVLSGYVCGAASDGSDSIPAQFC